MCVYTRCVQAQSTHPFRGQVVAFGACPTNGANAEQGRTTARGQPIVEVHRLPMCSTEVCYGAGESTHVLSRVQPYSFPFQLDFSALPNDFSLLLACAPLQCCSSLLGSGSANPANARWGFARRTLHVCSFLALDQTSSLDDRGASSSPFGSATGEKGSPGAKLYPRSRSQHS